MSHVTGLPKAGVRATTALVIGLAVATLGPVSPASAVAPPGPTGLNVAQPFPSTTKFNWNYSAGADRYEIQVDDSLDFSSPEVGTTTAGASTVNNVYVPEVALRTTTNYWRIRAVAGADKSDWVTGLPFDPPQVTVPIPASPVNGVHLQQPDNPPLLSWTPSPGAKSYTVEVASDPDFVNRLAPFTTETTSLVVTQPLALGDWFWRVTATKGPGVVSEPSNSSSFWIDPLTTPTITGPLGPQPNVSPDVLDVVLDWDKVPGAVGYELQVASNIDFTAGSLVEDRTGAQKRIFGTRFSPTITYDNNGYYWRVRAVDTAGNSSGWARSQVDFNRQYELSPELIYPADGATNVPDPLYFDWKAVTNASEYEIWVGSDVNFSPNTYNSCRVAQTTYTPGLFAINDTDLVNVLPNRINEDCDPKPGVTNYWRVRPLDRPYQKPGGGDLAGVQGLWSPTYSFGYTGLSMNNLAPANGATVDIPALSWDVTPGALTYTVSIRNGLGNVVDTVTTHGTSYTPKGFQRFPTANNPYTWSVYAETAEGTTSLAPQRQFIVTGNQPTFGSSVLTPLGPSPSAQFSGPPALTWEPDPAAAFYRVHATYPGGNVQVTKGLFETTSMPYASFTDSSSELKRPGTYTWWVTAHAANGAQIGGAGPSSTFQIRPFVAATGHKVALGGRAVDSTNPGQTPCTPLTGVCTVPATPVLKWDREPGTAFYIVYVSEDPSFSNLLEPTTALPATTNTIYTPALDNRDWTYADNQTERPFFWFVRPCRAVGQCGSGPVGVPNSAQHSFFKKSPPVTGLQSSLTDKTEVTMSWDNYWHNPNSLSASDKWGQTGEPLPQSGMKYRVEVSTDSTFSPSSIVDTADVDQSTYTSTSKIYANRTYWWRVQAVDSDDNGLTWSTQEATFLRETPQLNLLSPINNVNAPGTTAFRWQAQAYAKGYDVEVYKNDDPTFSIANRIANSNGLLTTAYTWNKALSPSASAYRWRVRRVDSSGNPGDWSTGGRFFVTAGTPNIIAPGAGSVQAPNGPVLEWEPLAGAATYTVTITPTGGGSAVIANTVSTAWAVTTRLNAGSYTWTLLAKDASGNTLGSSQSTFSVDAALTADLKPVILSPDGTGVGKTLSVTPPTWQGHTDVTVTYQWLRDGQPIFGAAPSSGTGPTYVIQAADIGKTLSVKATGSKPNYASGTTTSDGVVASAGDALVATSAPSITGTPAVGSILTAGPGTWAPAATSFGFKWLRNGTPIPSVALASYTVTAADAGAQLTVEVTANRSGYTSGTAVSAPVTVAGTPPASGGNLGTLSSTAAPVINGTAKVGGFLTATSGTWNSAPTSLKYQWYRAGAPIAGATASIYRATEADASQPLTVVVSASKANWTDGSATTAPVVVAKLTSTTSGLLMPTILKPGQRSKLMVTVMAIGITAPTGTLIVKDGKKTITKVTLKASKLGKMTIKLKGFKAGKHKLKVSYSGSTSVLASASRVIKITVRR